MKRRSLFSKLLISLFIIQVIFSLFGINHQARAACTLCGDVNETATVTLSDLISLFYLCFHQPYSVPCPSLADLDDYDSVNIRDVALLSSSIFFATPTPSCPPTNPMYLPTLSLADTLSTLFPLTLPALDSNLSIPIFFKNATSFAALSLPLKITVAGQVPLIDTVILGSRAATAPLKTAWVDTSAANINVGLVWLLDSLSAGLDTFLTIEISIPPDTVNRTVQVYTLGLPLNNYPFFVESISLNGYVPVFSGIGTIPLIVEAYSPVDLIVIDPNNDSIGVSFNTIPGATYSIPNDSVYISEVVSGFYRFKVVKDTLDLSGDTSYTITARIDGTADAILANNEPVPGEGEVHEYVIASDPPIPACLSLPGDANANGFYSLADVITTVNYIFNRAGCQPLPKCWFKGLLCRGDWNGSGTVSLVDVIRAVNYIFNKPGGPWNALPINICCL